MGSQGKWIGVDFDETLRRYDDTPIEAMVERVKRWLAEGIVVKIVTARMYVPQHHEFETEQDFIDACVENNRWRTANGGPSIEHQREFIQDWCEKHVGARLPVRYGKGPGMIEIWDDKAVRVEPNTGRRISASTVEKSVTEADHHFSVIEAARATVVQRKRVFLDMRELIAAVDDMDKFYKEACRDFSAAPGSSVVGADYDGGELRFANETLVNERERLKTRAPIEPISATKLLDYRKAILCKMKWVDAEVAAEILKEHDRLKSILDDRQKYDVDRAGNLANAARRVEHVMNDRKGFHVEGLDEETRSDLLLAIVCAANGVG